jgi:hypothetical protein
VTDKPRTPEATSTVSYTSLPVSQGARDLYAKIDADVPGSWSYNMHDVDEVLDILAAADPKDVTNLLWARRAGKL